MKAKWPEQLKSRILPTHKHVRRFGEFHTIYIILYLGVWIKFFFHLVIFIVFPNFIINLFLSVRRFFWSQQRDRRPEYPFFEMTFLVGCTAMLARTCTVTGVFHSHGGTPLSLDVFFENPNLKWMITRGTHGNTHVWDLETRAVVTGSLRDELPWLRWRHDMASRS